jgi:hypothetical protein
MRVRSKQIEGMGKGKGNQGELIWEKRKGTHRED